jgi:hypothetical protein
MRNNIFLPIVLFILYIFFVLLVIQIGEVEPFRSEASYILSLIIYFITAFITFPFLSIWQLYNIYKWIVKKYWNN